MDKIASIYQATVRTDQVRYRQEPTAAAGVAVADDAGWDEIIASTVLTAEHWLCALNIGAPAAGLGGDIEQVVAEGSGGTDGANAASTLLVEHDMLATSTTAVGEFAMPPIYLPVPIFVLASTRHAGRISFSVGSGMAISLGISYMTGLGR